MSRPAPRSAFVAMLATLLLGAVGLAACGGGGEDPVWDRVVATVNGHEIRESAVDGVRAEARLVGDDDDAAAALDQVIDRELLRREAAHLDVTVTAAAVDEREAAVAEQLGGEEALAAALEQAGMTGDQFRRSLEAAELLEAVRDARYPDVVASVADARRYYVRHRADLFTRAAAVDLGAIFVRNAGIAGNALERLRQGRPFEEVSRQFSIDPELKDSGGRLGWIDPRSLPGPLGAAVTKLRRGAVSKPIEGAGGVWVFKVFRRRPEKVTAFAAIRDELVAQLSVRARGRALRDWLERAREAAEITRL